MKFASLCVLSFQRPDFNKRSLSSLRRSTRFPHELIVNDDGSTIADTPLNLIDNWKAHDISHLILNGGKNMGVGKSLRNCIGVSSGDYIFKLDADLEYMPGWLETAIGILENNPDVGCVGLFNYRNYDPNDKRFEIIEEKPDCFIVTDFVNSGYGFKREIFEEFGDELGDDGWQQYVQTKGYKLAIPKTDVTVNFGFGKNSVYVQDGKVTGKSPTPLLFGNKNV